MKVFLAAVENSNIVAAIETMGIENGFFSYYYMRKQDEPIPLFKCRPHVSTIIVDSGAHTFFSESTDGLTVSVHTKKTKTKETPDEYFEAYLIWVKKFYDYFDYFVELDVGELVGQNKVLQWRERLKQHGVYDKCITVMHPRVVDFDAYLAQLEDSKSKYVALEGLRSTQAQINYYKYLKPAIERGIKVHGFALTNKKIIEKYPFYSVDSSSWKTGIQYGSYRHSVDGVSKGVHFRKNKWQLPMNVPNLMDVYHENSNVQILARLRLAVASYKDMQTFYTKLWKARGIDYSNFQVNHYEENKNDSV